MKNKYKTTTGDYVLYFGRLSQEKGVESLIKASQATPDINYKIIGEGPLGESLQIEKNDNVESLGFKKGRELQEIINKARLVIVPSVWYENAPLSILEAMQLGKVVLASDIGGIPEILPSDLLFKSGDIVDMAKQIVCWYKMDNVKLERKGKELENLIKKKYNSDIYIKELLSVYGRVQK